MDTKDLSRQSLSAAMPEWVPEVRYLDSTDSTNRVAREWAAAGASHGCLVVANYQSAGRGRLDRSWLAAAGSSLLFTLILRPGTAPENFGLINLAAGVAVCEAVAALNLDPRLKWPNDVNLAGGKVAGILSEAVGEAVCLGVGINVNIGAFPDSISQIATSLSLAAGKQLSRLELLIKVLEELDRLEIAHPGADVLTAYRGWCDTLGIRVKVKLADRTIVGRAQDVDAGGALILDSGEQINAGDVVHLDT